MVSFVDESNRVSVPSWVVDLASFRRWIDSDDVPENARVCYLEGEVWIDMSKEQLFTHLVVKSEFNIVLGGMIKKEKLGIYFPDGLFVSNVDADIGCKPDATFVSSASLQDRVRLLEGKKGGFVEIEGSPDMVLEVVSDSSVNKDKVVLKQAYCAAGAREYWLVDARPEALTFEIFRHTARGYRTARKKDGWIESAVFGKSFRLTREAGAGGHPDYTLKVR